jgi:parvulin-like peptidyl-prolyl isomerase
MTRQQPDPRLTAIPEVVGAVFAAPPGKVVGPVRGINGWYFARVNQLIPASTAAYDTLKGQISTEILTRRQQTFFTNFLGDMRARSKIEDLRNETSF